MALNTPKRIRTLASLASSPPNREYGSPPWHTTNSPSSTCGSPEFVVNQQVCEKNENRRGRPRSEALTTLMIEGSSSPSSIKCGYCNRVFPREKSLQAHLRTHTGERPHPCDYPGCTRAFTQSGQLKTHQRLHTGERPFVCSVPHCQQRFTHANRHCPDHPYDQLKRSDDFVIQAVSEQNSEVIKWLEKYRMEKEERTPTRKTPKRSKELQSDNNENSEIECPTTPNNPFKSRKGLMVELDMNAGLSSPITTKIKATPKVIQWNDLQLRDEESGDDEATPATSTFNPKKRWLREAWHDDLAKPLETTSTTTSVVTTHPDPKHINPNEMRPTVLMVASKHRTMPLIDVNYKTNFSDIDVGPIADYANNLGTQRNRPHDYIEEYSSGTFSNLCQPNHESPVGNRKWMGALALMQLASDEDKSDRHIIQEHYIYQSPDRYTHL